MDGSNEKLDIPSFAKHIKEKYPDYKDIDDVDLVERIVRKHPTYANQVNLPEKFRLLHTTSGYQKIDDLYEQIGREENVDPNLLLEQGRQETINFKPEVFYGKLDSPKGARGAAQMMPGTAPTYGLKVNDQIDERADPVKSVRAQAKYMRKLLDQFGGDENLALAGYNAGEFRKSLQKGQIPNIPETQKYVSTIGGNLQKARSKGLTLRSFLGDSPQPANEVYSKPFGGDIDKMGKQPSVSPTVPATQMVQNPQSQVVGSKSEIPPNVPVSQLLDKQGNLPEFIPYSDPLEQQYHEYLKASGQQNSKEAIDSFNQLQQTLANAANEQQKTLNDDYRKRYGQQTFQQPNQSPKAVKMVAKEPNADQTPLVAAKTNQEIAKGNAGTFVVDLSKTPKGMNKQAFAGREALRQIAGIYGLSDADIDNYIQANPDRLPKVTDKNGKEYEGEINISVQNQIIDEILNRKSNTPEFVPSTPEENAQRQNQELADQVNGTDEQLRTKVSEELNSEKQSRNNPTIKQAITNALYDGTHPLSALYDTSRKIYDQFTGNADKPMTEAEIQAEFERQKGEQLTPDEIAGAKRVADKLNSNVLGGLFGAAGRTWSTLAGIARPFSAIGISSPYDKASKIGKELQLAENLSGDHSFSSDLAKTLGGFGIDAARLALLSRLPGGSVIGFATDSGLQSAGRGENLTKIEKDASKGAAIGGLFPIAGKAGEAASKISPYFEPIARIGTVGVGTTGIELASGTPLNKAVQAGIMNALFEGVQTYGSKLVNKVGRIWAKGAPVDVKIDDTGNVSLVRYKGEENPNRVDFEMVLDPTDGVYKAASEVGQTPQTKSKNEQSPKEAIENNGNRIGSDENLPQRVLAEKNPIRMEKPKPEIVEKVKNDPRAQKLITILEKADSLSLDELQKQSKYSRENVMSAVDDLYASRAIEILPDNSVRLIKTDHVQPKVSNLYDKYAEQKEPIQLGESPEAENIKKAEIQAYRREQEAKNSTETATVNYEVPQTGKSQDVYTERGTKTKVYPKVIESTDMLTSLDPNYPMELQPRDRSRQASKAQIAEIANTLKPVFLDDSPKASDGRPLVVPVTVGGVTKYAVVSGNGRSEAIREAYKIGKEPSAEYKKFTVSKGANPNLTAPIYVGVLDPNEIKDLPAFAREANEQATAAMSATETAQSDAGRMSPDVLNAFVPSEDGSINPIANRDFIQAFMDKVPPTERGALVLPDGGLSQAGQIRIKNAILAKAFGNSEKGNDLIRRITETDDSGAKRITGALMQTAGKFAGLKQAIEDKVRYDNLDITENLVKAAEKFVYLKSQKTPVSTYLKQQKMFGDDLTPFENYVLQMFDRHESSQKAIGGILNNYLIAADALGDPNQAGLFGENIVPDAPSLLRAAIDSYHEGVYEKTEIQPENSNAGQTSDPQRSNEVESKTKETEHEAGQRYAGGVQSEKSGSRVLKKSSDFIPSSLDKNNVVSVTSDNGNWKVEFDTNQKINVPQYLGDQNTAIEYAVKATNDLNNNEAFNKLSQGSEELGKNVQELYDAKGLVKPENSFYKNAEDLDGIAPELLYEEALKQPFHQTEFGLKIDKSHAEILRRVQGIILLERGEKTIHDEFNIFRGQHFDNEWMVDIEQKINEIKGQYSPEIIKFLDNFVKSLKDLGKKDGSIVVYTDEDNSTKFHEVQHQASFLGSAQSDKSERVNIAQAINRIEYKIAKPYLLDFGYDNESDILTEELMAFIVENRFGEIGLTKAQAKDFAKFWFTSYAEKGHNLNHPKFDVANQGFTKEILEDVRNEQQTAISSRQPTKVRENNQTGTEEKAVGLRPDLKSPENNNQNKGLQDLDSSGDLSAVRQNYIKKTFGGNKELTKLAKTEFAIEKRQSIDNSFSRKVFDAVVDTANIPRGLKSSVDLSAPLRQGAILTLSELNIARKAFVKQLLSLKEANYEKFKRDLNLHPVIELAEDSGLYLSTLAEGDLNTREEAFMSRLLSDDPYFANKTGETVRRALTLHVRASERAYTTYLDSLRIESFAKLAKQIHEFNVRKNKADDPEQFKELARFINVATGRGSLGKLEDAAPVLNTIFFSPKYLASRLQLLNPFFYGKLPPGVRKIAMTKMLTFLGGTALIMLLLKLAGGEIEMDENDSGDFLKVRFGGFTFDMGAGLIQPVRLISRLIETASNSKTRGKNEIGLMSRFIRSKLAPVPGSVVNFYQGKDFVGNKVTAGSEAKNLVIPMLVDDIGKAYSAEGEKGLIKLIPGVFGVGVGIYPKKGSKK